MDPSCPSILQSRQPRHDACGHHHPPHVTCFGPDYTSHKPAPDLQGIHSGNTAATAHTQSLQSHMTATAAPDAACTPDIASALEACHWMW